MAVFWAQTGQKPSNRATLDVWVLVHILIDWSEKVRWPLKLVDRETVYAQQPSCIRQ